MRASSRPSRRMRRSSRPKADSQSAGYCLNSSSASTKGIRFRNEGRYPGRSSPVLCDLFDMVITPSELALECPELIELEVLQSLRQAVSAVAALIELGHHLGAKPTVFLGLVLEFQVGLEEPLEAQARLGVQLL